MKRIRFTRKTILLGIMIALLLGSGSVLAYVRLRNDPPKNSDSQRQAEQDKNINYDPPTEEEKQEANDQKQTIVEQEQQEQTYQSPSTAAVVISDARQYGNQIEVRAFVSNVYQDGTCTVTFTQGNHTVQKQVSAFKDATTTQCTGVDVPRSELPTAGAWTVKVVYQSTAATGEAQKVIQVQ
jgi:hypothetical protein